MLPGREGRIREYLKWRNNRQRGLEKRTQNLARLKLAKAEWGANEDQRYKVIYKINKLFKYGGYQIAKRETEIVEIKNSIENVDIESLEIKLLSELAKFPQERTERIYELVKANVKELVTFCEAQNLIELNMNNKLDDLCSNILLYNATHHAENSSPGIYTQMLSKHNEKIFASSGNHRKTIKKALENLYSLGYLETEDLDHLNQTFLTAEEYVEKKEKVKTRRESVIVYTPSVPQVSTEITDVPGYNLEMLEIVLVDSLRIKRKFIGNNYLPYRHVYTNALRRNPKLDWDAFEATLDSLVKDGVVMTKGQGTKKIYSINPKYTDCNNRTLVEYVKRELG